MRLLVASSNEGKIREIRRILAAAANATDRGHASDASGAVGESGVGRMGDDAWEVLSLTDLASLWKTETLGGLPPILEVDDAGVIAERYAELDRRMEETGTTFEENAVIKARGAAFYTGLLSLADDSGLEVDYLGGAPGVYSARYAGPGGDEQACNDLLLANMADAPADSRRARYQVVMALAGPDRLIHLTTGACEGSIGFTPRGDGGFGYDPLFVLPEGKRTMAELTMEEKNLISHRGKAMKQMAVFLSQRDII